MAAAYTTPAASRVHSLAMVGLIPLVVLFVNVVFFVVVLSDAARGQGDATAPPRPPANLRAADVRNDAGGRITLSWDLSPDDGPGSGYQILRAVSAAGPFAPVDTVVAGVTSYVDGPGLRDGKSYWYQVAFLRGHAAPSAAEFGPVRSRAQWFHTGRINAMVAVVLLSALVLYFIDRARRGDSIFVRRIAGLDAVNEAVGRATEMGRKILFIPGTGDMDNVQTLAGISILGRVSRITARYETQLDVPVSRSLVMVACRETVKEAYLAEGRPDQYREESIYYVTDDQFGYAAAMDGLMMREKPATIFLTGLFYAEALVLAETGNSIGAVQIAGTAEPSQLPFLVAACDYTLIGEELFLAGAYLSKEPLQLGSLKGQDMGKAVILALLLIGVIVQTAGWFDFSRLFVVE